MAPRERTTAQAQLERILYVLPAAAREDGVPVEELARALDVEPGTVLRDLEEATARVYYHPAGAVESFSISTDGRRVRVHAPREFQRPVRLNAREALALGLGLRALAADAEPERRAEILELARRLEDGLAAPDTRAEDLIADSLSLRDTVPPFADEDVSARSRLDDVEYEHARELMVAFDDDGFRGVVADAVELRRVCTLWYLKPGDTAPRRRRVAPHRLVYAAGMWYAAAHDLERDALRFFRMDRVLDAELEDVPAPAAPDRLEELLASGAPYVAEDDVEVGVRYSPRVARWVVERTSGQLEPDGSVLVRHRVADPRWLVRHVLQYGGEAVIEEPAEARGWVSAAAVRATG